MQEMAHSQQPLISLRGKPLIRLLLQKSIMINLLDIVVANEGEKMNILFTAGVIIF
jgi:hypothetical protein